MRRIVALFGVLILIAACAGGEEAAEQEAAESTPADTAATMDTLQVDTLMARDTAGGS
jgi:hypothetical protein